MSHRPAGIHATAVLMADGPIKNALSDHGVGTEIEQFRSRRPWDLADFARRLGRRMRALRPDLIFVVGNRAALAAIPVARSLGIPAVWYKVDIVMPAWQTALVGSLASRVLTVSEAAGQSVCRDRRIIAYPPVRLPHGFRVSQPRPPATIVCMGRLEPTKGQHLLLYAAAILTTRFPALKVLLAGAEPQYVSGYREELLNLAHRLGVQLELIGYVNDVEQLLERATVYVQPSFQDARGRGGEGLPVALVEASWAGLPVVGADTGGVAEAILNGRTGVLVQPCDPESLAAAIAAYLENPVIARAAGDEGARFARRRFKPERASALLFDQLAEVAYGRGSILSRRPAS